jgi:hypothetical protein
MPMRCPRSGALADVREVYISLGDPDRTRLLVIRHDEVVRRADPDIGDRDHRSRQLRALYRGPDERWA